MKTVSQTDLRRRSSEILGRVESGEQLTITVKGRPVAVIGPCPLRQWVPREEFVKILRTHDPDPTFYEDARSLNDVIQGSFDPDKD